MLHPPYSPDLASSNNYLFRSLQNSLNGTTFNDDEAVKSQLVQFFADTDQKFYERGIMKLSEKWEKAIEQNGKYIIDYTLFFVFKKMCLICMKKSAITSGTTYNITLKKKIRRYRHNCGSLTHIILEIYRKPRFACISSACMCIPNL